MKLKVLIRTVEISDNPIPLDSTSYLNGVVKCIYYSMIEAVENKDV